MSEELGRPERGKRTGEDYRSLKKDLTLRKEKIGCVKQLPCPKTLIVLAPCSWGSHPFMSRVKYTHIPYYINVCVCILVSYELAFIGSLTYYYILSAFDLFQISLYSLKPIHFFLGLKNLFVDSHKGHRPQELHLK